MITVAEDLQAFYRTWPEQEEARDCGTFRGDVKSSGKNGGRIGRYGARRPRVVTWFCYGERHAISISSVASGIAGYHFRLWMQCKFCIRRPYKVRIPAGFNSGATRYSAWCWRNIVGPERVYEQDRSVQGREVAGKKPSGVLDGPTKSSGDGNCATEPCELRGTVSTTQHKTG